MNVLVANLHLPGRIPQEGPKMKPLSILCTGMAAWALAAGIANGQIVPNNSFGATIMMNSIQNQLSISSIIANQSITNATRQSLEASRAQNPGPGIQSSQYTTAPPPVTAAPQYPINATDFIPLPGRLMPDQLVNSIPGASFLQKRYLRGVYYQFLADFETIGRRNNVAAAVTFAVNSSLFAVYGRYMTPWEIDQAIATYNNALAANPQFNAMGQQQKQMLYENMIILGRTVAGLQSDGIQQNNYMMQGQARELGQAVLRQWYGI
jgi:hypothetical protein